MFLHNFFREARNNILFCFVTFPCISMFPMLGLKTPWTVYVKSSKCKYDYANTDTTPKHATFSLPENTCPICINNIEHFKTKEMEFPGGSNLEFHFSY